MAERRLDVPVQVVVTKETAPGRVVYRYSVVNGSRFPITGLSIGNDDYADVTELEVPPIGWNGDSIPQTPASSVESPPNWSFEFLPTEGGEPGTADWTPDSTSHAIMGGMTMSGFAVVLPAEHAPYEQGHWTVYLNTNEEILYTGQLQPDIVTRSALRVDPNPSTGPITIRFTIPVAGMTSVDIFDSQGHAVKRLLRKTMPAGDTSLTWDGRDDAGRMVTPGVYAVRAKTATTTSLARITLKN